MISFHRDTSHVGDAKHFRFGWEAADVDDAARVTSGIARFPCSPIIWRDGHRLQDNFLRADWCALDFDDGAMTLTEAARIFCDTIHIIGTTKSHQVAKNGQAPRDRFRVLVKFAFPIERLDVYRATMLHYIQKYGSDPACKDGARFFWPCREIMAFARDGYTFDVIEPRPAKPRNFAAYRAQKAIPRWIQGVLRGGCPAGERNSMCFKLGVYLTHCGFAPHEIVTLIEQSPIDLPTDEIARAVANGSRNAALELKRG